MTNELYDEIFEIIDNDDHNEFLGIGAIDVVGSALKWLLLISEVGRKGHLHGCNLEDVKSERKKATVYLLSR